MKKSLTCLTAMLLVAACATAFAGGGNAQKAVGNLGNPGVAPPQSMPYGKSYGEWSAEWWKYCMPMTMEAMPFALGTDGTIGQSGPVWFLGGAFAWPNNLVREITVPAGTALFFPVFNLECSTLETGDWGDPNWGEAELRAQANYLDDVAFAPPPDGWGVQMYCTLDGVALNNLAQYRCETPLISITLPAGMASSVFGLATTQPTPLLSVGVGYYILLHPLPVGTHTLQFSGGDVQYTIHVVPHGP